MSDWIDDLKDKEANRSQDQRRREQWKLRCDSLIAAKAPDLWRELIARVKADFIKLSEVFPDKHLSFDDHHSDDHFTVTNPSKRWNCEARWMPEARVIRLHVRRAPDMLAPVELTRMEIMFSVTDDDSVLMKFEGITEMAAIAERLLKQIL
jgi:hypothetical protein